MGTDGTSHTQSDDGSSMPEFGDALDATTFEQVRFGGGGVDDASREDMFAWTGRRLEVDE